MAFVRSVLRPGMTFVDVGANIGLYSILAAKLVGATGTVLAIEPSPRERSALLGHLSRNGLSNVRVRSEAVSDEAGTTRLHLTDQYWGGQNTMGSPVHRGVEIVNSVEVDTATLDRLVLEEALGRIDCIKIDVEGAEAKVLRGSSDVLCTLRPVVLLELLEPALRQQGSSADEVLELLRGFGYEIYGFSAETGTPERWSGKGPLSPNIVAMAQPLTPKTARPR